MRLKNKALRHFKVAAVLFQSSLDCEVYKVLLGIGYVTLEVKGVLKSPLLTFKTI